MGSHARAALNPQPQVESWWILDPRQEPAALLPQASREVQTMTSQPTTSSSRQRPSTRASLTASGVDKEPWQREARAASIAYCVQISNEARWARLAREDARAGRSQYL